MFGEIFRKWIEDRRTRRVQHDTSCDIICITQCLLACSVCCGFLYMKRRIEFEVRFHMCQGSIADRSGMAKIRVCRGGPWRARLAKNDQIEMRGNHIAFPIISVPMPSNSRSFFYLDHGLAALLQHKPVRAGLASLNLACVGLIYFTFVMKQRGRGLDPPPKKVNMAVNVTVTDRTL
jgi:hypothetical protein